MKFISKGAPPKHFSIHIHLKPKISSSSESLAHASSYNSDHFTFTSSDEEILKEMDQEHIVVGPLR
jgi:hypothetical protein